MPRIKRTAEEIAQIPRIAVVKIFFTTFRKSLVILYEHFDFPH